MRGEALSAPRVSVVLSLAGESREGLAAARSVLRQTLEALELIVIDDAGVTAHVLVAEDARVSQLAHGEGPALARALSQARGAWVTLMDADERYHPERLSRLLEAARRCNAAAIGDDHIRFSRDDATAPAPRLKGRYASADQWAEAPSLLSDANQLGPLSFVFERTALEQAGGLKDRLGRAAAYEAALRMARGGQRVRICHLPLGFREIAAPLASEKARTEADELSRAIDAFAEAAPDLAKAARTGKARLKRMRAPTLRPPRVRGPLKRAVLLSRQRIVGATSGASQYVLSLARALRQAGFAVDFVGVSPKLFGRWPVLRLRKDTKAFDTMAVRGGVRIGDWIWASDPRVAWAALLAGTTKILRALGMRLRHGPRPAEWSISAPAERADMLYVARHVRGGANLVLCDYAFLAPMAPYALAPGAPSIVVMHDLWSAPGANLAHEPATNLIAHITAADEMALLSQADAALAIQPEEAALVRERLKHTRTILTPFAVSAGQAAAHAQGGAEDVVLFVGSHTAPNAEGLDWFLRECWGAISAKRPNARLLVAGSVNRALGAAPAHVEFLGVVDDLKPLYERAGVVIAPLRTGSGLKIKLVEAMSAGKAIVATPVAVRGVRSLVEDALIVEDDPKRFAAAVSDLLGAPAQRAALGGAALTLAARHFSEPSCYQEFIAYALGLSETVSVVLAASSTHFI